MTWWKTSSLTTDLNILLICHSQPSRQVKATVMAAWGMPRGRKKKASEQMDTAVMINVMLHPAVNIRVCCSFEKWSLIWAMLVKASGEQVVYFLWCMTRWGKRPNWGLKTRILRWWESWHTDLENGCKINIGEMVLISTQKQVISLYSWKRFNLSLVWST